MEGDSIRTSGNDTFVDIWIEGKVRSICISRAAIDAHLGFDRGTNLSEDDRREFVRSNLPLLISAAKTRLAETGPTADSILIDAGQLPGGKAGERRKKERRKAERRKVAKPASELPHGERRRGDRRHADRRRSPKKPGS
jgi:hypothetical protein